MELVGPTEVVEPEQTLIQCPDCDKTFKNAAGAGRHRTAVHGKRLDGRSVKARKRTKSVKAKTVKETLVTFELEQGIVKIRLTPDEASKILMAHSEEALRSLLG